jgi:diaminopimelate epimerase
VKISFKKMNGTGNDFVIVDNRKGEVSLAAEQVARVCDRRRGVGADGLILIESSRGDDFLMHFYNSDGSEAEMCGNGAMCSAAFAAAAGLGETEGERTALRFATGSGPISARAARMGEPGAERYRVAMEMMDAGEMRLDVPVRVADRTGTVHFMVVGTRHAVVPVEDATRLTGNEIEELGRLLRWDPAFEPAGANVNFVSMDEGGRIHIRTYEKGVEAETHACGTGSVAAAVVFAHQGRCASPAVVVQRSGDELGVRFELCPTGATNVYLEGPAEVNFEGTIDI